MIGNDVVDLALAITQSNWKRKGYLEKIFTLSEIKIIQNSANQGKKVWELWSRKEAVYKIIMQKGGKRGFYPINIECLEKGIVQFENQLFYTKTYFSNDFIYSEALENKEDFEKIMPLENSNSIYKINGMPFLKINNKTVSVSKTHHGRFEKSVYLKL
ncbi:4'-phosphopantetheinyl transferase superfamily protein [Flavobacterium sp.]|uniref:4'-phosphopantetheinyl transferase family protein n=1 Tax=Flavobacterium sp. TaxID=239 RepID=UPI003750F3BE